MESPRKSRRRRWRVRPKKNRNYTTYEISRMAGVHRNTVRRWIRDGKLPALKDEKPMLVLGADAVEFEQKQRGTKTPCALDELFCFACRVPRKPAFDAVEYHPMNDRFGTLRALCCECSTVMCKGFSARRLAELSTVLELSVVPASGTSNDTTNAVGNVHKKEASQSHA
ncbi:MAG: helix-turn-helix domain-containing protein [Rhizobiaceae bacterium]